MGFMQVFIHSHTGEDTQLHTLISCVLLVSCKSLGIATFPPADSLQSLNSTAKPEASLGPCTQVKHISTSISRLTQQSHSAVSWHAHIQQYTLVVNVPKCQRCCTPFPSVGRARSANLLTPHSQTYAFQLGGLVQWPTHHPHPPTHPHPLISLGQESYNCVSLHQTKIRLLCNAPQHHQRPFLLLHWNELFVFTLP